MSLDLFVDKTKTIDREALRKYVLEKLSLYRTEMDRLINGNNHEFWSDLNNAIVNDKNKDKLVPVQSQIKNLVEFIDGWIHTAVDTSERFEFFILCKAQEIKSGDNQRDYFWAMEIRHDQLVGLVRVMDSLLRLLNGWVNKGARDVINDPVFQGMVDHSVEDQVYYEAEKVQKERKAIGNV